MFMDCRQLAALLRLQLAGLKGTVLHVKTLRGATKADSVMLNWQPELHFCHCETFWLRRFTEWRRLSESTCTPVTWVLFYNITVRLFTDLVHHCKNTIHALLWCVFFFWQLHRVSLRDEIIISATAQNINKNNNNKASRRAASTEPATYHHLIYGVNDVQHLVPRNVAVIIKVV